jgi:hypothetical protein
MEWAGVSGEKWELRVSGDNRKAGGTDCIQETQKTQKAQNAKAFVPSVCRSLNQLKTRTRI